MWLAMGLEMPSTSKSATLLGTGAILLWATLASLTAAMLFQVNDIPALRKLGLYREEAV